MVESILLTAGKSSRMGSDKALLQVQHISVIERILQELTAVSECVNIVVGDNFEMIKEHLLSSFVDLSKVHFALNKKAHLGMFSSLKKGFAACNCDLPILLQMIDQPFVDEDTYEILIESFDDEHLIFQPSIMIDGIQKIGHPILFSPTFRQVILAEPDKANLREVIGRFKHKRKLVTVNDNSILHNINSLSDFKMKLKEYTHGNSAI